VHEAPVPTPVPKIVEKIIENYIEVPYDDIREKLCEESAPFGALPGSSSVVHTTNIIEKEVVKEVEVKRVIEKEKLVYIKTAEVKAEEALYNAKLERQRQRMKAKMLVLCCHAVLLCACRRHSSRCAASVLLIVCAHEFVSPLTRRGMFLGRFPPRRSPTKAG